MNIWKWLGWDTKEARTERDHKYSEQKKIQWLVVFLAAIVITGFIWG